MSTTEFNYTTITKYIVLGTRFHRPEDVEEVLRGGVRAVVDLHLEKRDRPQDLVAYLWLPVHDYNAPSVEQFFLGVDFIDQLVRRRVKTYIHCNVGFGRAPVMVAAYLCAIRGYSVAEAIKELSHRRPGVSPNPGQIKGLQKFLTAFHKSRKGRILI